MVDLGVRQQDPCHGRGADAVAGSAASDSSCWRRSGEALARNHGPVVSADRERRLRPRSCAVTRARGLAGRAAAVPLRKPPTGGGAEDPDAHAGDDFRSLPVEDVRGDLRTQLDDLKLRLDPRHSASYRGGVPIRQLDGCRGPRRARAAEPISRRPAGGGRRSWGPARGGGSRSGGDRARGRRAAGRRRARARRRGAADGGRPCGARAARRRHGRVGARRVAAVPRGRRSGRWSRAPSSAATTPGAGRAAARRPASTASSSAARRRPRARGAPRRARRALDERRPRARRRAAERRHARGPRRARRGASRPPRRGPRPRRRRPAALAAVGGERPTPRR